MPNQPSVLDDLLAVAKHVGAHLTVHCNYSPTAARHPDADWSAQLLWTADLDGTGNQPYSVYGAGPTLQAAVSAAIDQLEITL